MPNLTLNEQSKKEQIISALKDRYVDIGLFPPRLINVTDKDQLKDQLSRALAAFVVQKAASIEDINIVAKAVVDCDKDNGIDAIYFDRRQNTLWLVQSKYGETLNQADTLKFIKGITDLLSGLYENFNFQGDNPKFNRLIPDIEEALSIPITKIVALVVYLGSALGPHTNRDLDLLKSNQNDGKEWFDWDDVGLAKLHRWLAYEHAMKVIDVELTLENWNIVRLPNRAVYGLVRADHINELFRQHGNVLFQKNIRYFLGRRPVNRSIAETVEKKPSELFFLNNGLTILCSNFGYTGNSKDRAKFTLKKFSIVNGAQTVGSIGIASRTGQISDEAKLMVTILEVGEDEASSELSQRITIARNTQTAVKQDDFVALDPIQEKLRQELAISGIVYNYRPTEIQLKIINQFSLKDAAKALACFSQKISDVVALKREIGEITTRRGSYYSRLFNNDLTGASLYRKVQISRYFEKVLLSSEQIEQGRRKMFFRHGRYFIMHIWARRSQAMLNKAEFILSEDDKLEISRHILVIAEEIWTIAEAMFTADPKGYLKIFRNLTDAEPLAQAVMRHINQAEEA